MIWCVWTRTSRLGDVVSNYMQIFMCYVKIKLSIFLPYPGHVQGRWCSKAGLASTLRVRLGTSQHGRPNHPRQVPDRTPTQGALPHQGSERPGIQ